MSVFITHITQHIDCFLSSLKKIVEKLCHLFFILGIGRCEVFISSLCDSFLLVIYIFLQINNAFETTNKLYAYIIPSSGFSCDEILKFN